MLQCARKGVGTQWQLQVISAVIPKLGGKSPYFYAILAREENHCLECLNEKPRKLPRIYGLLQCLIQ